MEDEWRYLNYIPNTYSIPNVYNNINERKRYLKKDVIKEIILGYDFFDLKEYNRKDRTKEYETINLKGNNEKFKKKLKRKLLNFIVKHDIEVSMIYRDKRNYELDPFKIIIEKLGSNTFRFYKTIDAM
jgi:hypothetical protein